MQSKGDMVIVTGLISKPKQGSLAADMSSKQIEEAEGFRVDLMACAPQMQIFCGEGAKQFEKKPPVLHESAKAIQAIDAWWFARINLADSFKKVPKHNVENKVELD